MAEHTVIGLRYCGGCNPRYDRLAAVDHLRARLPWADLRPAAPGQRAVLVVCGCSARCADVSDLDGQLIWLCSREDADRTVQALGRVKL